MLWRESTRTSLPGFPVVAVAAVTLFLLRNRQIAVGSSPGSGVAIAGAELLVRVSAMLHTCLSIAERGLSLLLRIATAPWHLAFVALQSDFRMAVFAIEAFASLLHMANAWLVHLL